MAENNVSNMMSFTRQVYDYCQGINKQQDPSPLRFSSNKKKIFKEITRKCFGIDLYGKIEYFLQTYTAQLMIQMQELFKDDKVVLASYAREWKKYKTSAETLEKGFHYLSRTYVAYEMNYQGNVIYDILSLALLFWRDNLFTHLNKQVSLYLC